MFTMRTWTNPGQRATFRPRFTRVVLTVRRGDATVIEPHVGQPTCPKDEEAKGT